MGSLFETNGRLTSETSDWQPHDAPQHVSLPPAWGICQRCYLQVKLVAETLFALILALLAAPLILISALLVRLTSAGPALYSQLRIGRKERTYTIHKIRTMTHNCEQHSGPCWSVPGDPRITWVGKFLRRTHLDELPQLWNVLFGHMALVGPRPERREFVPRLQNVIPLYGDRLLVRPGVTGLAQVQLPPDTDLTSVRRKLAYDLYYVHNISFWLDLRILICTGLYVLGGPFYRLTRFLLPSEATVKKFYHELCASLEKHKDQAADVPEAAPPLKAAGKKPSPNGTGTNGCPVASNSPTRLLGRA